MAASHPDDASCQNNSQNKMKRYTKVPAGYLMVLQQGDNVTGRQAYKICVILSDLKSAQICDAFRSTKICGKPSNLKGLLEIELCKY